MLSEENGLKSVISYARDTFSNTPDTLIGKILYYPGKKTTGLVVIEKSKSGQEKVTLLLESGNLSQSSLLSRHQEKGEINGDDYLVDIADDGKSFKLIEQDDLPEMDLPHDDEDGASETKDVEMEDDIVQGFLDALELRSTQTYPVMSSSSENSTSTSTSTSTFPSVVSSLPILLPHLQRKQKKESPTDIIDAYFGT